MGNLTPRERVKISLSRKEPDRVPLDLGEGRQTSIYPVPYRKISKILGFTEVNIVYSPRATIDSFDERILTAFDIDFRRISLRNLPVLLEDAKGIRYDIWGIGWKRSEDFWSPFYAPLREATIDDLDKYNWPDPNDQRYFFGLRDEAKYKFKNTNYALVANQPNLAYGVMTTAYFMRGMDQFFMDLAINKAFAILLMDKVLEYHLQLYEKYLDEVGEYIEVIQTGDDLGMQTGPFFSLDMYRETIKPKEKTLMDLIKNKTKAKIFYHCDGSVFSFIEDLIEPSDKILDLGPFNPFSRILKEMGYNVQNTHEEVDLDLDYEIVKSREFEVVTAFEVFEHLVSPFPLLCSIKAPKLIASVPLTLWFSKAYWNENDPRDRHYHELPFPYCSFKWNPHDDPTRPGHAG